MSGISYLSTKDRESLTLLNESLTTLDDPVLLAKVRGKIIEISDSAKPLNKCTPEDCVDLEVQLSRKLQSAISIGKKSIARQYQMLIVSVHERYMTAQLEVMTSENVKAQSATEDAKLAALSKILGTPVHDPKSKDGTTETKPSKPKNSWAVDFGE